MILKSPVFAATLVQSWRRAPPPVMEKHLIADGSEDVGSMPAEFTAHIKAESEQWKRVIKQGGTKAQWLQCRAVNPPNLISKVVSGSYLSC